MLRREPKDRREFAIVHDHLVQRGGAERIVALLSQTLPGARVHTSLYEPSRTYPEFGGVDVRPMAVNRFSFFRVDHRRALPLLPALFGLKRIQADTVVVSTSGWAHFVRTKGRRITYWHSPNRWIYSPKGALSGRLPLLRVALGLASKPLSWIDRAAAKAGGTHFANSRETSDRLRRYYGLTAVVLPPPMMLDLSSVSIPLADLPPGFALLVSRLQPYKNIEAAFDAFRLRPEDRLVLIGTGPAETNYRRMAPANVIVVGRVSDAELCWAYRSCRLLLAPAVEDFGLTPIEAAAFGKPTVALRSGGYLDTVVEGVNGLYFEESTPLSIDRALSASERHDFSPDVIRAHAEQYSLSSFVNRLRGSFETS